MSKETILVIAPHPDDETLGCGGTLFKMKAEGHNINWLIVTSLNPDHQLNTNLTVEKRNAEIEEITVLYGFEKVKQLEIPTTKIDTLPMGDLIEKFSKVIDDIRPTTILIPFINDVHTDHYYTSKAVLSCCKWFRHSSIKNILYYETISETDFNINSVDKKMNLNVYIDISKHYSKKVEAMKIYSSELLDFPFPRSLKAIDALASLRGSQCGLEKAEAFELLYGVIS